MFPRPLILLALSAASALADHIHFGRQIRPILSENCFFCHGPDEAKREAGLRLDDETAAKSDNDGTIAIVPGHPEKSALLQRILSSDPDEVMPPPKLHKIIPPAQIALLTEWIKQGAPWGKHWSYEPVKKPSPPSATRNPVDAFLLTRLTQEKLTFSPEAPPHALLRRLALDLTGLPPTPEEFDRLLPLITTDYPAVVDHYLAMPAYGEHWASQWMDLARYADSSGYPSDQPREIWAWRDWVISAFNRNQPFDQFTIDQLAGDLLPQATQDQLIATAFHRNTMTQNEGGTSDEEFRNAAIIDRVNTTMAVWMGTTISCAQCHTHKYDPITITEYYQFYDFLNQTADADKKDEAPFHSFLTSEQQSQRISLQNEIHQLETRFKNPPTEWLAGLDTWDSQFPRDLAWQTPSPSAALAQSKHPIQIAPNGSLSVDKPAETDTYTITLPLKDPQLTAIQLRTEPTPQNFVITSVTADLVPSSTTPPPAARYVRLELPGNKRFLQLAEIEVLSSGQNIARKGKATQSSRYTTADAALAIDGRTDGNYANGSVAHTNEESNPWWQLDLTSAQPIDSIRIWNRTDGKVGSRLEGYRLILLDAQKQPVWTLENQPAPELSATHPTTGTISLAFSQALADFEQPGFTAASVLKPTSKKDQGWAVAGATDKPHTLSLLTKSPVTVPPGSSLRITIKQNSPHKNHTLKNFSLALSSDPRVRLIITTPAPILTALRTQPDRRTPAHQSTLRDHYLRTISKATAPTRQRLAKLEKDLAAIKPTTVPIMTELPPDKHRKSHIQNRGEWQNLGAEVHATTPAAFHPLPKDARRNRLTLARWLVSKDNPLTARVTVNRYWESLFGTGIVRSSEDFGSQGDLPVHPELLDWLAADLMDSGWNLKHLLKTLVTSTAYRQDSTTPPALAERDPENRLLARGPRFRPSGELLRDQALAVSGLLSTKLGGPPVRPMTPNMGLSTAFGRSNDWIVSEGPDKHRRSLYTEVRRNSPYASFTTFDAGNREVCMIRRNRTNTPLQAFVTLNDPVFIETHQALSRRLLTDPTLTTDTARLNRLFELILCRPPTEKETTTLLQVLTDTQTHFTTHPKEAETFATEPLGPLPPNLPPTQAATWTTLTNIVLNLDEFLMRR
jgi:mono/diheme cytochrome c family protein